MDTQNLEIGEGNLTVEYGSEGTGTDVGICIGANIKVEVEDLDVEAGQQIDPVDNFDIKRMIQFAVTLKEDTMRNLVLAMGGDPADIDDVGTPGHTIYVLPGGSVQGGEFSELVYTVARVKDKTKNKVFYEQINEGMVLWDENDKK